MISSAPYKYGIDIVQGTNIYNMMPYAIDRHGGVFFLMIGEKNSYHTKCRESFERGMATRRGWNIGLWMGGLKSKRLDQVISIAETRLKLKVKTIIYQTNNAGMVVIKPSSWWKKTRIRREVLTLLIRLGACYYNGDWSAALSRYHLTDRYMPEVLERFLSGYTNIRGNRHLGNGIYSFFYHKEAKSIPYWLTKEPAIKPKKVT